MISIIIPTLNEERYLPDLLRCIGSQDYRDYEIIVSDGNSEDRTREIAKEHGCKLVVSKKRSPAHQRNQGALKAEGDILLFLDADTLLPEGFLTSTLEEFDRRKLDVAGFYFKFNSGGAVYGVYSVICYVTCFLAQYIKPLSIGACIVSKKEFHEKVGGFDETIFFGEDHIYSHSIVGMGGRFRLITSKNIYYSVRRFEKEGRVKTPLKWLYGVVYYLFNGPPRKNIVAYEFGGDSR